MTKSNIGIISREEVDNKKMGEKGESKEGKERKEGMIILNLFPCLPYKTICWGRPSKKSPNKDLLKVLIGTLSIETWE